MDNEHFSMLLIDAIKHRYGRLIPSTKLARELDRVTKGEVSLSSEAVRKWIRALSIPNGNALVALDELLGDYFVEKRKLKNFKNPILNQLNNMGIPELMETQRLIHSQIESSLQKELSQPSASSSPGSQE